MASAGSNNGLFSLDNPPWTHFLLDTLLVGLLAVLIVHLIFSSYVESTRDVPSLYLTQQLVEEATRQEMESAVHKSNKLDHSHGLRVGLDIRYDHYKLRNGNLCDVWELYMALVKKNSKSSVHVNGTELSATVLNSQMALLGAHLASLGTKEVALPISLFLASLASLAVIWACFINQITVCLYDSVKSVEAGDIDVFFVQKKDPVPENAKVLFLDGNGPDSFEEIASNGILSAFSNDYHFSKDRGVALRIARRLNPSVVTTVSFTVGNLISALASSLKHLPPSHAVSNSDKVVVVLDPKASNEALTNSLNKVLVGLVSHANVEVLSDPELLTLKRLQELQPSVLCLSELAFLSLFPQNELSSSLSWFQSLFVQQLVKFLSKGKFSVNRYLWTGVLGPSLRLVYVHKLVAAKSSTSSVELNTFRSLLSSRIVVEQGYFSIFGPFLQTDFYDYRVISTATLPNYRGFGCLNQSVEIKLVNYDAKSPGDILVRGYNIGKTSTKVLDYSENEPEPVHGKRYSDGFMPLPNIRAKWGTDGCLYVYS